MGLFRQTQVDALNRAREDLRQATVEASLHHGGHPTPERNRAARVLEAAKNNATPAERRAAGL